MAAEELAKDVLQHVGGLHDDDEEGDQEELPPSPPGIGSVISAGTWLTQKIATITPPLDLGDALHETVVSAPERNRDRHQKEDVDRMKIA